MRQRPSSKKSSNIFIQINTIPFKLAPLCEMHAFLIRLLILPKNSPPIFSIKFSGKINSLNNAPKIYSLCYLMYIFVIVYLLGLLILPQNVIEIIAGEFIH